MVDLVSIGRKSLVLTKASLSIFIRHALGNDSSDLVIITLLPSLMSILNQSIVDQNYIENEDLVSTIDFRIQSALHWERSIPILHSVNWTYPVQGLGHHIVMT